MEQDTGTENSTIPQRSELLPPQGDVRRRHRHAISPLVGVPMLIASVILFTPSLSLKADGLFSKKRGSSSSRFQKPSGKLFSKFRTRTTTRTYPTKPRTSSSKSTSYSRPSSAKSYPATALPELEKPKPGTIRVFVLSDSQGQTEFGPEFRKQLLDHEYEVVFHAVKNGTPYFWSGDWKSPVLTRVFEPTSSLDSAEGATPWKNYSMRPRSLGEYVDAYNPDIFVIQAGTNFESDLVDGNAARMSKRITRCLTDAQKKGARILWVGPPDARDDVKSPSMQMRATETLRNTLAPISEAQGYDCFFDSRPVCPMSNSTRGDGEHPTVSNAIAWAGEAAEWVAGSISDMECDRILRSRDPASSSPKETSPDPFGHLDTELTMEPFETHLRLVAKSALPDTHSFEYTNAFAVYLYSLGECETSADSLGLTNCNHPGLAGFRAVYVLHWAYHNRGDGSPLTPIHQREEGNVYPMSLVPLEKHPLKGAMSTMAQFNDFNDFNAPLFVAANVMEESAP